MYNEENKEVGKMRTMIKLVAAVILLGMVSGCFSPYVLEGSKKIGAMRVATARGDEAAIKAIRLIQHFIKMVLILSGCLR